MALVAITEQDFETLKSDIQEIKAALLNKTPQSEDLITEEVLFQKLGNPNKSTIWRWEKRGALKPIKIGNSKMYRISDLVSFASKKSKK
jgi:hypothetical protein